MALFTSFLDSLRNDEEGQGLAEYALILALIAIVAIVALIFLGAQSLWRLRRPEAGATTPGPGPGRPGSRSFVEGLLTNLLNPKVAIFYLAFLPQFVGVTDVVFLKSVLLAAIHVGMGVVWLSLVSVFVATLRSFIERRRVRRTLEGVTGAVLVALGLRLALERR